MPEGHLALPVGGTGNPVLVLHAWWGLNETVRAFCDRLAADGFVAFAPDLYHGEVVDTIEGAERLSGSLDTARAKADVADAARFVRARAGSDDGELAVIGLSLGAYFALDLSTTDELVRAVVLFYGTGPADFSTSRATYLGHFAEHDEFEPRAQVDALEAELARAGRAVTFHHYAGTGHWFFEPDRSDAHNEAAATLAWERTRAFLKDSASRRGRAVTTSDPHEQTHATDARATGAFVLVYRREAGEPQFLILHRSVHPPEYDGDWAWTPPGGVREKGEALLDCASRELREETGLHGVLLRSPAGSPTWAMFSMEVKEGITISLDDGEHDRFEWVSLDAAIARCRPEVVSNAVRDVAASLGMK